MQQTTRLSLSTYAVIIAMIFIAGLRMTKVNRYETSWDVLGYYLPLPATFIYDDPLMKDRSWVEKANTDRGGELSGTIYQVSTNDEGEPIYFFLIGMAIFYLPFFLIGHGSAAIGGYPMDGFSEPYQYALVAGGIVYTIIGLFILRKILLHFFHERVAAIVILILVFATNYSHHLSYKNLETVNILFMLMCWLLWSTIRWHREHKQGYVVQIAVAVVLMWLVKPTEVLAAFIPLLWGVYNRETLRAKWQLLKNNKRQVFIALGIALLIALPQLIYWQIRTGHLVYDSYKNAGIGLDLTHPHILNVLFSFRKGWLVYTPVMILGIIGLVIFYRKNRSEAFAPILYFVISFYILSSWTEWWYGAAFSCRPVITSYPILAIGIGVCLTAIGALWLRITATVFIALCTALNLFQWWQLMHYIYDPYRTTKEYYFAIFGKTSPPVNGEDLKLVYRSFEAGQGWTDRERYQLAKQFQVLSSPYEGNDEFLPALNQSYEGITDLDHAWVTVDIVYSTSDSLTGYGPFITTTMLHKGEAYSYQAPPLRERTDTINGKLTAHFEYLTPEVRVPGDVLSSYIWNPSKTQLRVESYTVKCFVRK